MAKNVFLWYDEENWEPTQVLTWTLLHCFKCPNDSVRGIFAKRVSGYLEIRFYCSEIPHQTPRILRRLRRA